MVPNGLQHQVWSLTDPYSGKVVFICQSKGRPSYAGWRREGSEGRKRTWLLGLKARGLAPPLTLLGTYPTKLDAWEAWGEFIVSAFERGEAVFNNYTKEGPQLRAEVIKRRSAANISKAEPSEL